MASRTSGRGDERSGTRNSNSTNANTTRRPTTTAPSSTDSARQNAADSTSQGATRARDAQPQQTQGSSDASGSQTRGDQQRELRTSREQGNMRPAASAQRSGVTREIGNAPSYGSAGSTPFALMRRMMEDMDRLFSDFGFPHPGMFGSSLFNPALRPGGQPGQRTLGDASSGTSSRSPAARGQQSVQRGGQSGGLQQSRFGGLWAPQVEVFERGNTLVVRADLPGLSRENVDVELDEDALIIRGERRNDVEDESDGLYRSERSYGSFYRAIPLPEGIDASACNASFKDGVLEVTLPKPPQQRSKAQRIDVRGS
jgi:HSP20 family protein